MSNKILSLQGKKVFYVRENLEDYLTELSVNSPKSELKSPGQILIMNSPRKQKIKELKNVMPPLIVEEGKIKVGESKRTKTYIELNQAKILDNNSICEKN